MLFSLSTLALLSVSLTSTSASPFPRETFADCLGAKGVPVRYTSSPDFSALSQPFNLRTPFTPLVFTLPTSSSHVASTIRCAAKYGHKVTARSGGHSYAAFGLGGENGHVIVDLQMMHDVKYDAKSTTALIGAGARLGNIAQALYDQGKRAIPHGTCPGVGIGGHSLHGGFGNAGRMWGLSLDNILAMTVVLADGRIVEASATVNPDLYWGLRGAGPNFGIVTRFKFKTYAAPENNVIYWYRWSNVDAVTAAKIFVKIQGWVSVNAPKEMSAGISLFSNTGREFDFSGVYHGHSAQQFQTLIASLMASLPATSNQSVREANWINTLINFAGQNSLTVPAVNYNEHNTFYAKSLVTDQASPMTQAQLTSFFNYATNAGVPANTQQNLPWFVIVNLYGGRGSVINNAQLLNTASYAHRSALWTWQFYTNIKALSGVSSQQAVAFTAGFVNSVARKGDGAYVNYVDPTLSRQTSWTQYYGAQVGRLQQLKNKFDKGRLFYWPQSF